MCSWLLTSGAQGSNLSADHGLSFRRLTVRAGTCAVIPSTGGWAPLKYPADSKFGARNTDPSSPSSPWAWSLTSSLHSPHARPESSQPQSSHVHKVLEITPAATSPRGFLGAPPAHSSPYPRSLCHKPGCLYREQSSTERLVPPGIQGLRKTRAQTVRTTLRSLSDRGYSTFTPRDGSEAQPLPFTPERDIQSHDATGSGSHTSSHHPFSNHHVNPFVPSHLPDQGLPPASEHLNLLSA